MSSHYSKRQNRPPPPHTPRGWSPEYSCSFRRCCQRCSCLRTFCPASATAVPWLLSTLTPTLDSSRPNGSDLSSYFILMCNYPLLIYRCRIVYVLDQRNKKIIFQPSWRKYCFGIRKINIIIVCCWREFSLLKLWSKSTIYIYMKFDVVVLTR